MEDGDGGEGGVDGTEDAALGLGFLGFRRLTPAEPACGTDFVPGDRVELSADGFAPNSTVKLQVVGVSVLETSLPSVDLPSVVADAEGRIKTVWTIPDPAGQPDSSVPRLYSAAAGGTDPAGSDFLANMFLPLIAYPGSKPCVLDDAAVTSLGRPVRIAVLSNDTAPQGGTMDPASILVEEPVTGGEFVLNPADGSLTFTPDPGFYGTTVAHYRVSDGWGLVFRAEIVVTVNAGCTVTGAAGAVEIAGTDGDDVICVPDPSDRAAFHIIDAKGGNDVILAGNGVEWIYGGPGEDEIHAREGKDTIEAGPGIDTIYSGAGYDTIYSTDTADTIIDDPDDYELIIVQD